MTDAARSLYIDSKHPHVLSPGDPRRQEAFENVKVDLTRWRRKRSCVHAAHRLGIG